MKEQALRFGIHDGAGHRAATWKLWTKTGTGKSDVYLTCREHYGIIHVSLHESGQWHTAFSPPTFEKDVKGAIPKFKDRFIEKWNRPPEIAPGVTLALRIATPWWSMSQSVKEGRFKGVTWLPSAPELMATEIAILFTKPTTQITEWPGRSSMDTSFIGALLLANREIVWAVYRTADMPDLSSLGTGTGCFLKGKVKKT